jgi:serine/threonine protein kinase
MQPPADFRDLTDDEFDQLQDRADRFAATRQRGPVEDWESFLPESGERLRGLTLRELIKIDLDFGWRNGQGQTLEQYAARFPELGPAGKLPFDLIAEEFRFRHSHGDKPALAAYHTRFPGREAELSRLATQVAPTQTPAQPPIDTSINLESMADDPKPPSVASFKQKKPTPADEPADSPPRPKARREAEVRVSNGYELHLMLGQGHFGEVWKAKAPGGIDVAVKMMHHSADREGSKRELSSLEKIKNLRHPCLLATQAYWFDDNRLHIAMELADCTLRNRLDACQRQGLPGIPPEELLIYMRESAEGLDFLHHKSLLHRDVKPDNILLLAGHAKVADYGLAKQISKQMMTVSFAGTPVYMAPEIWGGKACDQSDLYSLAFCYVELRTGRRPLSGDDFVTIMSQHLEMNPDLTGLEPGEESVVRRALSKKPENRQATCLEFVYGLEDALGFHNSHRIRPMSALSAPPSAQTPAVSPKAKTVGPSDVTRHSGTPSSAPTKVRPERREAVPSLANSIDSAADTERIPGSVYTQPPPVEEKTPPRPEPVPPGRNWLLLVGGVALVPLLVVVAVVVVKLFPTPVIEPPTGGRVPEPTKPEPTKPKIDGQKPRIPIPWPKLAPISPDAPREVFDGKEYYKTLVYTPKNTEKVRFLLVPGDPALGIKPFYVMEQKVWTALFAEFVAELGEVKGGEWRDGQPHWPVTKVGVDDAARFAAWLGGLLPTPEQWSQAAGRLLKPGPNPLVAVNRATPESVFAMTDDLNAAGVRNLAGNGCEWTRQVIDTKTKQRRTVPVDHPTDTEVVELRGRMYTLKTPLTFELLNAEAGDPQTNRYTAVSAYTSFRVVLELP